MSLCQKTRLHGISLLAGIALLGACDQGAQPRATASSVKASATQGPDAARSANATAHPAGTPKSLSLAMYCAATAKALAGRSDSGLPQEDLQRVEASARQYALQEASAQGMPGAEVERQISAVLKLSIRKLTPQDAGDESARAAQAEAGSLSTQLKSDCLQVF